MPHNLHPAGSRPLRPDTSSSVSGEVRRASRGPSSPLSAPRALDAPEVLLALHSDERVAGDALRGVIYGGAISVALWILIWTFAYPFLGVLSEVSF